MTVEKMMRALGEKKDFHGCPGMQVYEVEQWKPGKEARPGVLYVAEPGRAGNSEPVLEVDALEIPGILQTLQGLLSRDYRINVALTRLNQAISMGSTMEDIADICYEIIGYPVFFLNEQLSVTAGSGGEGAEVFLSSVLSGQDVNMNLGAVTIPAGKGCPYPSILAPVYHTKKLTGYILIILQGKDGEDPWEYLDIVRNIMANRIRLDDFGIRTSKKQQFLYELIQRHITDEVVIERKKKELGFPEYDKYYVLSVRTDGSKNLVFLRGALEAIIKEQVFEYGHYMLAVVGCSIREKISDSTYPGLAAFLEKNNMMAGLSNGFLDYVCIRAAFEQSITAIPLREKMLGEEIRFCRYEDQILTHLLVMAEQNGMAYESFCHPNVVYIERYDREHGTEYLKTLTAYVFNITKLAETADKLYIHRNTLYHRINTLKEEFGIDFENQRELMKLRISCTAYGYWGAVKDSHKLFGPMS